jgi:hypothetical protein
MIIDKKKEGRMKEQQRTFKINSASPANDGRKMA